MTFFIGIVPPERIYNDILHIQQQFGDNKTEPHITIKPPVTLTNADEWLQSLATVTAAFPPFTIELTKTGMFGTRVLFIDSIAEKLRPLHKAIQAATIAFEQADTKQQQPFNPHLTLGRKWCGFTASDFVAMRKLADELLSKGPLIFPVLSVRVYCKQKSGGKYERFKDLNLMGQEQNESNIAS